ncbi:MAG: iron export ABC transporter permease subunit FetB [Ilumatobacteraceae bacterium]
MNSNTVGWWGLAASLIFVVVAIALTSSFRLGLSRTISIATGRSLVQLLVVGSALTLVIDPDTSLAWSWAWVAGIIVFAAYTVTRRVPQVPNLLPVTLASNVAVAVVGLAIVFGFGVFDLDSRSLVPVSGMIIGNSMKSGVVAAMRVVEASAEQRAEIEAGLALGMSTRQASARFVRSALRTAISPQIEQTAGLGIVFLPGAMTGLLLAGADPLDAVRAQLALMYVILSGTVVGSIVTGLGTVSRLTTPAETLRVTHRASR